VHEDLGAGARAPGPRARPCGNGRMPIRRVPDDESSPASSTQRLPGAASISASANNVFRLRVKTNPRQERGARRPSISPPTLAPPDGLFTIRLAFREALGRRDRSHSTHSTRVTNPRVSRTRRPPQPSDSSRLSQQQQPLHQLSSATAIAPSASGAPRRDGGGCARWRRPGGSPGFRLRPSRPPERAHSYDTSVSAANFSSLNPT